MVVAGADGRAEHSNTPAVVERRPRRELPPLVGHGVPDVEGEIRTRPRHAGEEDAAVAVLARERFALVGAGRVDRGGRDEAGHAAGVPFPDVAEEAEHRGRGVERAESAAEARGGDEAAPGLADEGGANEARGLRGREAEDDLLDDLVRQGLGSTRRRRRRHADSSERNPGGRRGAERGLGE